METSTIKMETTITGTENNTFEICRVWDKTKPNCIVLELYPVISVRTSNISRMDLSSFHLLEHITELGDFGSVSVCNLFSMVCSTGKPSARKLKEDTPNITYLRKLFENKVSEDTVIFLAWGNSLASNQTCIKMKTAIIKILKEKGLEKQCRYISASGFPEKNIYHPLFLGIRAKHNWQPVPVSLNELLKEQLQEELKEEPKQAKRGRKKHISAKEEVGL